MLFNQTVAWRPAPFAPIAGVRARVMAQAVPASELPTPVKAIPTSVKAIALTIAVAMAGATAWGRPRRRRQAHGPAVGPGLHRRDRGRLVRRGRPGQSGRPRLSGNQGTRDGARAYARGQHPIA